ncbi:MAG: SGNH hydrolase domain-containing protein [Actinomycetota bacterium]
MRILVRLLLVLVAVAALVGGASLVLRDGSQSDRGVSVRPPSQTPPSSPVPAPTTTTVEPGFSLPLAPRPTRIAWAGDSVAFTLARAFAAEANARGVEVVDRSTPGCGMIRGLAADDDFTPFGFVSACDPGIPTAQTVTAGTGADVVTWLSSWETSNRLVDGGRFVFGTPEADAKILALVDESVGRLTSRGARVVFILNPPLTSGRIRPTVDPQDVVDMHHLGDLLRRYAAEHPDRTAVLDLEPFVCPTGPPCPTEVDGVTLRPDDGGHFSSAGAASIAPQLAEALLGPA